MTMISMEGWHIFASKNLDHKIFLDEEACKEAFLKITEQWLLEPQQITKTILRADVLQDDLFSPEGGNGILRASYRRLLPRCPHKDISIFQRVELISSPDALVVDHIPVFFIGQDSAIPNEITREVICLFKPQDCCQGKFPSFHPEVSGYRFNLNLIDKTVNIYARFGKNEDCLRLHSEKAKYVLTKVGDLLVKFMGNFLKGYVKRVNHDVIIPKVAYQDMYQEIKGKFQHWVTKWPEATDPAKFVFEELGIATFLHLLWNKSTAFVDLGCGNGFLTHVLTELGHSGKGIDLVQRQIWSLYSSSTVLEANTIIPASEKYQEEWLIGNHSDELTPWIPVMAALSGYDSKFMILPCCFYDFSGAKYSGVMDGKLGKYENYCLYLQWIMKQCGYVPEPEYLRIPSTKNLAWVGRRRSFERDDKASEGAIHKQIMAMIESVQFLPCKSEQEKAKIRAVKKMPEL